MNFGNRLWCAIFFCAIALRQRKAQSHILRYSTQYQLGFLRVSKSSPLRQKQKWLVTTVE